MVRIVKTGVDVETEIIPFKTLQKIQITGDPSKRDQKNLSDGAHKVKRIRKLRRDWKPESAAGSQFVEQVTEQLDSIRSGIPDYDSGYFKISSGKNSYPLEHNFGSLPTRSQLYYTNESDVKESAAVYELSSGLDYRYTGAQFVSGILLLHNVRGNTSYIITGADFVFAHTNTSGILRVMLWR